MSAPVTNISTWEAELARDPRLNGNTRLVAHLLAEYFRDNNGRCQRSVDAIASEANIVSRKTVSDALLRLRLTGWVAVARVGNTARRGLQYQPRMAEQLQAAGGNRQSF
jgi:hypothetical protein